MRKFYKPPASRLASAGPILSNETSDETSHLDNTKDNSHNNNHNPNNNLQNHNHHSFTKPFLRSTKSWSDPIYGSSSLTPSNLSNNELLCSPPLPLQFSTIPEEPANSQNLDTGQKFHHSSNTNEFLDTGQNTNFQASNKNVKIDYSFNFQDHTIFDNFDKFRQKNNENSGKKVQEQQASGAKLAQVKRGELPATTQQQSHKQPLSRKIAVNNLERKASCSSSSQNLTDNDSGHQDLTISSISENSASNNSNNNSIVEPKTRVGQITGKLGRCGSVVRSVQLSRPNEKIEVLIKRVPRKTKSVDLLDEDSNSLDNSLEDDDVSRNTCNLPTSDNATFIETVLISSDSLSPDENDEEKPPDPEKIPNNNNNFDETLRQEEQRLIHDLRSYASSSSATLSFLSDTDIDNGFYSDNGMATGLFKKNT